MGLTIQPPNKCNLQRWTETPTDLDILLQTTDELTVHLARLGGPEAAALSLTKSVLQDATGLAGLVQLLPQLLQLIHVFLHVDIPHLQHLGPQLLDLILQEKEMGQIPRSHGGGPLATPGKQTRGPWGYRLNNNP